MPLWVEQVQHHCDIGRRTLFRLFRWLDWPLCWPAILLGMPGGLLSFYPFGSCTRSRGGSRWSRCGLPGCSATATLVDVSFFGNSVGLIGSFVGPPFLLACLYGLLLRYCMRRQRHKPKDRRAHDNCDLPFHFVVSFKHPDQLSLDHLYHIIETSAAVGVSITSLSGSGDTSEGPASHAIHPRCCSRLSTTGVGASIPACSDRIMRANVTGSRYARQRVANIGPKCCGSHSGSPTPFRSMVYADCCYGARCAQYSSKHSIHKTVA